MFKSIRKSKLSRFMACYLAIQLVGTVIAPTAAYALTSGPSQPEFNSFTPIGTSDMVNLSSGDFNYNIPIMDVGGYPLNLAYDSGITMDQEASWVGLGWNLNVGQINRQVRGLPDDFDGDEITYENNLLANKTTGINLRVNPQILGAEIVDNNDAPTGETEDVGINLGLGVEYNNYQGVSFKPSFGLSFALTDNLNTGFTMASTSAQGVSLSPNVNLHGRLSSNEKSSLNGISGRLGFGVAYNSRQGLSNFNIATSVNKQFEKKIKGFKTDKKMSTNFGVEGNGSISFLNNTFTPIKRNSFFNQNYTFAFSLGLDFWGIDAEVGLDGYGFKQEIKDEIAIEKAFGYNNTHNASKNDILDFNKEKDRARSQNTLVLSATNYTYDLYSINGQGISGMFRPYRGQVDYVYDRFVQDESFSASFGVEIEGATGFHLGADLEISPSASHTGVWETGATSYFKPTKSNQNEANYEQVYFKTIGEMRVDNESSLFDHKLGGAAPITIALNEAPSSFGRFGVNRFKKKLYSENGDSNLLDMPSFSNPLKRENRDLRNRVVTTYTKKEIEGLNQNIISSINDGFMKANDNARDHHTGGIQVLQADGSTYVYGETAYNLLKEEVTFAVPNNGDCETGLVQFSGTDDSRSNSNGVDNYFNKIITPPYAHTYLLSSVLSSDYEDITGDGPSDDDLGSYTKFSYSQKEAGYKWRIPYLDQTASFNEGLKTNTLDQRGNYIRGEKEIKYIDKIETKTHVAIFDLSSRKDGIGASESGEMYKINKISLYSKPEYNEMINGNSSILPIKTAHFEYDYSQCRGVPNNLGGEPDEYESYTTENGVGVNQGGKLTLRSVFFTYRKSNLGKYTPYQFNYSDFNPDYNLKGYDVWGNYKENMGNCSPSGTDLTAAEFPFVQQEDKELQNMYVGAWSLNKIGLPSGGELNISYETDDYQFVQDKRAMQMFKIAGVTQEDKIPNSDDVNDPLLRSVLFNPDNYSQDARYLIVELPEQEETVVDFREQYIGAHENEPIYFRFLMNMVAGQPQSYDYVDGYFEIDTDAPLGSDNTSNNRYYLFSEGQKYYAAIRMKFSDLEGGANGSKNVNPIAKASWYFARQYLNRQAYGLSFDPGSEDVGDIARSLVSSFGAFAEIFTGPNQALRSRQCGRLFNPEKSWIRLQHSGDRKFGGGLRVKEVTLSDQWDQMIDVSPSQEELQYYRSQYGQHYNYELSDGGSSGVATYEPNMSKENPFVMPFYDEGERLVAPQEVSYVEEPFGESFFPSPTVTYRRVAVKNLEKYKDGIKLRKHATGKVVNEFFTSYDFPVKTDHTALNENGFASNENSVGTLLLTGLLGLSVDTDTELALSQGFVIETNDMNGKQKYQKIYNESGALISGVDYVYNTDVNGDINSKVPVISNTGAVSVDKSIGMHYDVVTDFRENYTNTNIIGINTNVASFFIPLPPFVVVIPVAPPKFVNHERTLHTTTTTKVIHRSGIMLEKIAYDLGSRVSTKNLAWDEASGQVLLTSTVNEYDDQYYNFTYPAHWFYNGMDKASNNIGVEGLLKFSNAQPQSEGRELFTYEQTGSLSSEDIFTLGDELYTVELDYETGDEIANSVERLWVVNILGNSITLMNRDGKVINQTCSEITKENDLRFRIIRSGYRNQHTSSMASITTQKNPIDLDNDGVFNPLTSASFISLTKPNNHQILNASAIEYKDYWKLQTERNLPKFPTSVANAFEIADNSDFAISPETYGFNPYVYNVKGKWRAVRSYAYLSGRTSIDQNTLKVSPRKQGFFTSFNPFYKLNNNDEWVKNDHNWTFASKVSQYSPYGSELENVDALDRYSSAQYGYNYTLPTAVSSNSKYAQMGFDGFEDYAYDGNNNNNNVDSHFALATGISIQNLTDNVAHSGNYSLAVSGGTEVTYTSNLSKDDYEVEQPEDCTPPPNESVSIICPGVTQYQMDLTGYCIESLTACHDSGTVCELTARPLLYGLLPDKDYVVEINITQQDQGSNAILLNNGLVIKTGNGNQGYAEMLLVSDNDEEVHFTLSVYGQGEDNLLGSCTGYWEELDPPYGGGLNYNYPDECE